MKENKGYASRFTKKLPAIVLITLMLISIFSPFMDSLFPILPVEAGTPWLIGWSYRKSHVVTESFGAGTEYQKRIVVHRTTGSDGGEDVYVGSKCLLNFGDIRFTDDDQVTLLYYFMGYLGADYAVFWIKINDSLDSYDVLIYVYYGNSGASTTSNFYLTFVFGEPFSSGTLNTTTWTSVDGTPVYTIDSSYHYLEVTDMAKSQYWTGKGFHSRTFTFPTNYAIEDPYASAADQGYQMYWYSYSEGAGQLFGSMFSIHHGTWSSADYGIGFNRYNDNQAAQSICLPSAGVGGNDDYSGANLGGGPLTQRWRIWKDVGTIKITQGGTQRVSEVNSETSDRVHLGLAMFDPGYYFGTVRFYAFMIRKYINPEPAHGAWGSENSNPPTISNFEAPSELMKDIYTYINATIRDDDGAATILNATIELTGGIVLGWFQNGTFAIVANPSSIATLTAGSCIKTVINASAYELSWYIKFSGAWANGYKHVVITTTRVYDEGGIYGDNSKTNLLYFYASIARNDAITIINMEAVNYVFVETKYYIFRAQYLITDPDTFMIAFSDDYNWINASYDVSEDSWSLLSGDEISDIALGSYSYSSGTSICYFYLYFSSGLYDAYDVDIYMYCNMTDGTEDEWEVKAINYFNIYCLGGKVYYSYTGSSGHTTGGDAWEIWAGGQYYGDILFDEGFAGNDFLTNWNLYSYGASELSINDQIYKTGEGDKHSAKIYGQIGTARSTIFQDSMYFFANDQFWTEYCLGTSYIASGDFWYGSSNVYSALLYSGYIDTKSDIFDETFHAGFNQGGWIATAPGGIDKGNYITWTWTMANPDDEKGDEYALEMHNSDNTWGATDIYNDFEEQSSGTFRAQTYVWISDNTGSETGIQFIGSSTRVSIQFGYDPDFDGIYFMNSSSMEEYLGIDFSANSWYNVTVVFDMGAHAYDLYINTVLRLDDEPFITVGSIYRIRLNTVEISDVNVFAYFDSIKIWKTVKGGAYPSDAYIEIPSLGNVPKSTMYLNFFIRTDSASQGSSSCFVMDGDSVILGIYFGYAADYDGIYASSGSSYLDTTQNFVADTWYNITVIIYLNNDMYDLYVGVVQAADDYILNTGSPNKVRFVSSYGTTAKKTYIDEVNIQVTILASYATLDSSVPLVTSGVVNYQTYVYTRSKSSGYFYISFNSGSTFLTEVAFGYATDYDGIYYCDNTGYHLIETYSPDTWYNVTISADATANNYDIYIDTVLKVNNANFISAGDPDKIQYTSSERETYIDEVKVWIPQTGGYGGTARVTAAFKNLKHVNIQFALSIPYGDSVLGHVDEGYVEWGIDYCINNVWIINGWFCRISISDAQQDGSNNWIKLKVLWMTNFTGTPDTIRTDYIYTFWEGRDGDFDVMRLWLDLWFNKLNASTVTGGRLNTYYLGMHDNSNPWFSWLTGKNWGAMMEADSITPFYVDLRNSANNIISCRAISLMRLRCKVWRSANYDYRWILRNFDLVEFKANEKTMEGVNTPSMVAPKTPDMPQGGFLQVIYSLLGSLGSIIWSTLNNYYFPILTAYANTAIAILNYILSFTGNSHLFSDIIAFTATIAGQIVNAVIFVGYVVIYIAQFLATGFVIVLTYMIVPLINIIIFLLSPLATFISGLGGALLIAGAWLNGTSVVVFGSTYNFTSLYAITYGGFHGGSAIFAIMAILYLFMLPFFCLSRMSLEPALAPIRLVSNLLTSLMGIGSFFMSILRTLKFW